MIDQEMFGRLGIAIVDVCSEGLSSKADLLAQMWMITRPDVTGTETDLTPHMRPLLEGSELGEIIDCGTCWQVFDPDGNRLYCLVGVAVKREVLEALAAGEYPELTDEDRPLLESALLFALSEEGITIDPENGEDGKVVKMTGFGGDAKVDIDHTFRTVNAEEVERRVNELNSQLDDLFGTTTEGGQHDTG